MKRRILTSIAICMTLLSCEKTFILTVDGSDEHKMNLFCATGAIDSTIICLETVMAAIPDPAPDPQNAEIIFKVNGKPYETSYRESWRGQETEFKEMNRYFVMGSRLETGDKVTIDISLDGAAPVHAETTVPPAPEEPEVTLSNEDNGYILNITYSESDPDAYLGLRIRSRHESWESQLIDGEWTDSEKYIIWNNIYGLGNALDIMLAFEEENLKEIMTGEGPVCFWKNDIIKEDENGQKSLVFNVGTAMGNWEWEQNDDLISYGREYFVISLYRLSEELYTAYDNILHNDADVLGHMGLSPVHYKYTNVKGGFGVLGGVSESTVTIPVE